MDAGGLSRKEEARAAHTIIVTEGGAPTPVQRGCPGDLLAGRSVRVAVLSDNSAVRRAVMAMSWINGNVRAFRAMGLSDALEHLAIPESRADLIDRELTRMRRMVDPAGGTCSTGGAS
ncbi:MAG: hypothetical protein QM820_04625 [Minicystis sp.]